MREVICVCADIPTVDTATRFVILRHQLETLKATNTARMASLAMPNSEIVTYGLEPVNFDVVAPAGTWLLYPEAEGKPPPGRPERVLVLDGNWPQTRRMLHRLPELRKLPRLSLAPPRADRLRMRKPPARSAVSTGMSTLEAIAQAVRALEGEEKGAALDAFYDAVTDRVMRARGLIK